LTKDGKFTVANAPPPVEVTESNLMLVSSKLLSVSAVVKFRPLKMAVVFVLGDAAHVTAICPV
jgi:hypothetical protein